MTVLWSRRRNSIALSNGQELIEKTRRVKPKIWILFIEKLLLRWISAQPLLLSLTKVVAVDLHFARKMPWPTISDGQSRPYWPVWHLHFSSVSCLFYFQFLINGLLKFPPDFYSKEILWTSKEETVLAGLVLRHFQARTGFTCNPFCQPLPCCSVPGRSLHLVCTMWLKMWFKWEYLKEKTTSKS